MIQDIICAVRELDNLRNLKSISDQAAREFNIAFSQSCFARGHEVAAFQGFTVSGMRIDVPDPEPTADSGEGPE